LPSAGPNLSIRRFAWGQGGKKRFNISEPVRNRGIGVTARWLLDAQPMINLGGAPPSGAGK
jgi:hypothetical protein